MNSKRTEELDWLKAICIMLMVAFHLVYFEHLYPQAKDVVYVFHMPVFLLISGYLMKAEKPVRTFAKNMAALLIPYIIMEVAYCIAASILPINEHIDNLSFNILAKNVLLYPIGPYWFLHTLILCSCLWYAIYKLNRTSITTRLLLFTLALLIASMLKIATFSIIMYFLAGVALRVANFNFLSFFKPSFVSLLLVPTFIAFIPNLDKANCAGAIFIYLMISAMLVCYKYIKGIVRDVFLFVGRNTLPILLFSPLFTFAAKYYQTLLCSIDETGMLFMIISVIFGTFGSIMIQKILSWMKIWQIITLKKQ